MEGGDLVVENKNNDQSYITVEGVGMMQRQMAGEFV
jgi:hypothetical protein